MKASGRGLAVLGLVALAATASANAAMGRALEIFDFKIWTVYVVITILFEAWFIGRRFEFSWSRSIMFSALFNAITAFTCAGGLFAPFLHTYIGTHPFVHTLTILTMFGIASAVVEGAFWDAARKKKNMKGSSLGRSFLAHLIGVPLSLAILLLPARPYPGLEHSAYNWRYGEIRQLTREAYTDGKALYAEEVVQFATPEEFKRAFLDVADDPELARRALLTPDFGRFSSSDGEPFVIELNHERPEERQWLVRFRDPKGGGITIDDEWVFTRMGANE